MGTKHNLCNSSLFSVAAAFHWTQRRPSVGDNETQPHPVQPGKTDTQANLPRQVTRSHSAHGTKTTKTRPTTPCNIIRSHFHEWI